MFKKKDADELNFEQDLEALKADIDQLGQDVAHLMWKSTVGQVEHKISRRPLHSVLWAFGAGLACCTLMKLFRSK